MVTRPTVSISSIEFSGSQRFDFLPNEKIILVGSNNSGKSQTLREIIQICNSGSQGRTVVLKSIGLNKTGDQKDLQNFLDSNADFNDKVYNYKSWSLPVHAISNWSSQSYLQGGLAAGFIKNIDANDRLQICNQQNSISAKEQKSKPQHVLYDDSALMKKVSGLFRAAFGRDIMFDYRGGKVMPIHVGQLPEDHLVDRVGCDESIE